MVISRKVPLSAVKGCKNQEHEWRVLSTESKKTVQKVLKQCSKCYVSYIAKSQIKQDIS